MLQITNIDAGGVNPGPLRNGPAYLSANKTYLIPFAATARPAFGANLAPGNPADRAIRTSSECYMRGLKERITIRTDSGAPWQWRRICIKMRGSKFYDQESGTNRMLSYLDNADIPQGMARVATTWTQSDTAWAVLCEELFAGTRGYDWSDEMLAPLDKNRVSVAYDYTTTIRSGNESGVYRTVNRWHPMNKTLYYDDQDKGDRLDSRRWSMEGNRGMGDYYIFDFIKGNGSPDDQLAIEYNSTLYWHEK